MLKLLRGRRAAHSWKLFAPTLSRKIFARISAAFACCCPHGQDPQVGYKPIGKIRSLREDNVGLAYEVELFDVAYASDLLPALRAEQYGASFRFERLKENRYPAGRNSLRPKWPLRELTEVRLVEFGPTTFGAYPVATAHVRGLAAVGLTTTSPPL